MFFNHFSIAITSLVEERANLNAFRTFVRFALVWFCLFPLSLGVCKGLRFVIVALPGLFSYLFLYNERDIVFTSARQSSPHSVVLILVVKNLINQARLIKL